MFVMTKVILILRLLQTLLLHYTLCHLLQTPEALRQSLRVNFNTVLKVAVK